MGTSKGYKMPSGGEWGPLKREATDFAQNIGIKPVAPQSLLSHYVRVRSSGSGESSGGGQKSSGSTGSGGGGGGRVGAWRAGTGTAQRLGGFLSRVGEVGLAEALRENGLGDLVGRPASEISGALLEEFAGPASTLDQAAAREALVELNDELLAEAKTFDDVEVALGKMLDQGGIFEVLLRFFGHYLYSCFCRDFYERLLKKVGASQAGQSLKSIKDCIQSAIKAKLSGRDPRTFNWRGTDGKKLSEQVLAEVLDIYGVSV
jgi:hypothetical protein